MSGPDSGAVLPIDSGRQTIGRSRVAGLTIDDPSIEPHHGLLDWDDPRLSSQAFGGEIRVENLGTDTTVALGASLCGIRDKCELPSPSSTIFHRALQDRQESLSAPIRSELPGERQAPLSPPVVPIAGGVVVGLTMALVTRQLLFGLFAITTGVMTFLTWAVSQVVYRRSMARWRQSCNEVKESFHVANIDFTYRLVHQRRRRHRSIGELRHCAEKGDSQLWAHRNIDEVRVGIETREVTVKGDDVPIIVSHYPRTVKISSGQILGVHGTRAHQSVTALLTRLAVEVGPADWQLIFVGDAGDEWNSLRQFPHVRMTPLDRFDLENSATDLRHRVLLVNQKEFVAQRTSIARRVLQRDNVSMIVVSRQLNDLPAICTDSVSADEYGIDGMSQTTALEFAHALQQWVDPDHEAGMIPKSVSFSKHFLAATTQSQAIAAGWHKQDQACLSVLVGESADGPIAIDLINDGPHAVVVGTTGSGKSDFLKAMVMTIALQYSPADVNFILIDYKGGAAFDSCAELPHVVGVITDLDEGLAARVLVSLEAELRDRERRLREDASTHLPRLMVVVDELAALKDDVPNFIGSLVSIAQRGRSLGFHLVVATQRPGSALSADVMANANIRLALRVQSAHDAQEIVGSSVPAGFSRDTPGRVALRLGSDELYIFQAVHLDVDTQALVKIAKEACALLGTSRPRRPWLDALPTQLFENAVNGLDGNAEVLVGLIDDPANQRQVPLYWETTQHAFIVGSAKSGKSSALAMMRNRSVGHGHQVFSISCSGSGSSVAQHIDVSDRELLRRLLQLMIHRIDGPPVLDTEERWILFIDDIDIWRNHFIDDRIGLDNWTMFERIFLEGPHRNIVCVISGVQPTALPAMLSSRLKQTWLLTSPPGRCTVAWDGRELFAQLFMPSNVVASDQQFVSKQLELRRLPSVIDIDSLTEASAWAVAAEDRSEISLPLSNSICLFGEPDSGCSTTIEAMFHAWRSIHPLGEVFDLRKGAEAKEFNGLGDDRRRLVLADESTVDPLIKEFLSQATQGGGNVTIIVSSSPNFVRIHPEHWINTLRRSRTGLLLGRAACEDADLLGVYATQAHVYGEAAGRGLWVVNGCPMGIVQSASAKFEAVA
jgi:S-DNA-T family DNA segregation ATPase FtsK/SpoIIIE